VTFRNGIEAGKRLELQSALERAVEGRIGAMDIVGPVVTVAPKGDDATLTISNIKKSTERTMINERVTQPFSFVIKVELPTESGAITANASAASTLGNWQETGITQTDIKGVQVLYDSKSGESAIEILPTTEGHLKFEKVFADSEGKSLGIFVRDLLISKLVVQGTTNNERILITGVPSVDIAKAFADDVNVGISLTITPHSL
jgi:hypothetical protein